MMNKWGKGYSCKELGDGLIGIGEEFNYGYEGRG